jgi:hypothetical protein
VILLAVVIGTRRDQKLPRKTYKAICGSGLLGMSSDFRLVTRALSDLHLASTQNLLGLIRSQGKMHFAMPMWRNGRRNGLKIHGFTCGNIRHCRFFAGFPRNLGICRARWDSG